MESHKRPTEDPTTLFCAFFQAGGRMEFDGGLSARLLRLVAFQGNVGLWDAVLQELQPRKVSSCGAPGTKKLRVAAAAAAAPFTGCIKAAQVPVFFLAYCSSSRTRLSFGKWVLQ